MSQYSSKGNMDAPKEDLKGDGFDGFPRKLLEDCVEYTIYILNQDASTEPEIRESLKKVQAAANALVKGLLEDYIWQRESFSLKLERPKNGRSILRGRTNYGDSIEDEWLIVYLLRELSKQFSNAWINVTDTDGEFLLVEAANSLPRWLNPEIAANRVWINKGQLFIIPLSTMGVGKRQMETAMPGNLELEKALKFITNNRPELCHSQLVEEEAFYRIRNYPKQISGNLHHSLILIPRKLAYILHEHPPYISAAVEAFYLRDPIAMKLLRPERETDLIFPPDDLVTARIRFAKVGYAQVHSQEFAGPKTWMNAIIKRGITFNDRATIGMKLTCGFEMLLADPHNQDKKDVREMKLLLEDLGSGEAKLPADDEIKSWGMQEDSDKWLDIDFKEFEEELSSRGAPKGKKGGGFGDQNTQENLRRIVSQFESFLNDGAGDLDEMDFDDDSDNEEVSSDSEGEDKAASYEEDEFTAMMREMMGMPPETMREIMGVGQEKPKTKGKEPVRKIVVEEVEDSEDEEIQRLTEQFEAELKEAGALRLDSGPSKIKNAANHDDDEEKEYDSDDEILDVDLNLVTNILESFKSQAGMAGPASNMLGMMGMRLPRDDPDNEEKS